MISYLLAGAALAVCAALMLRLCLGERRQQRLDAALWRAVYGCRRQVLRLWTWRASRKHAEKLAEEAIRRARSGVLRDGNVYQPKSFRGPHKPH